MDRRKQLGNVAFGGDWSEAIVPREAVQEALGVLQEAVERCREDDPRNQRSFAALDVVRRATRGNMLADAWWRAAGTVNQGLRLEEMQRAQAVIVSVIGNAVE